MKPSNINRNFWRLFLLTLSVISLLKTDQHAGPIARAQERPVSFISSVLSGTTGLFNPTSLQFGPDGRLYVATQDGTIFVYKITRNSPTHYLVTEIETIDLIKTIANHNEDGALNPEVNTRLVLGILVAGTETNPVIYVTSADPRIAIGVDLGLDTNSAIISRLTWNGTAWEKLDLVRGMPRSEENHSLNGMQLDAENNILYVASGGNTNMGAPSNNLGLTPEYAYSAAILAVDLNAIGNTTYDVPTLDDPARPDIAPGVDENDPFGGGNGANQAKLVPGGPVQIYSPGYRNPYDLVITESGRMYTIDNGANGGWGGPPIGANTPYCVNEINESDTTSYKDGLHYITGPGYYGGHPAPARGNPQGIFGDESLSPVPFSMANPLECRHYPPGENGALALFNASTNGLTEYTATNFEGEMQGDLLAASLDGNVYRIKLSETGDTVVPFADGQDYQVLFAGFGSAPLDVIAQGDDEVFPGTVWVAVFGSSKIQVFEPVDFPCSGIDDATVDEDGDGFDNAEEIAVNSNPCSWGSQPADNDGDLVSDIKDPDDDDDGIVDLDDPFAIDPNNGLTTTLPLFYDLFNYDPGFGFFGVGFTGLMRNGYDDYLTLFDPTKLTFGGASGRATIDEVTAGTALGNNNSQQNAFQFGVGVNIETGPFIVEVRLAAPFFEDGDPAAPPLNFQSQGFFIGTGDQDNYLKITLVANGGNGGIEVVQEDGSIVETDIFSVAGLLEASAIDLYLLVDPVAGSVQPQYSTDGRARIDLGTPLNLSGKLLEVIQGPQAMAVGIIASSQGAKPFIATWDYIVVKPAQPGIVGLSAHQVDFGLIETNTSETRTLALYNFGLMGDPAIDITGIELSGDLDIIFADKPTLPLTLAPEANVALELVMAPGIAGRKSATLTITHTGINSPLTIAISGASNTLAEQVLYRVNAGGPPLNDTPINWSGDTESNPSSFVNTGRTFGSNTFEGANNTGAPDAVFASERWDHISGENMRWSFPVEPGVYEVRLYFAETFSDINAPRIRIFDIKIEDKLVLDNYDIIADVGFATAVMKSFTVAVVDGELSIEFAHVTHQNPMVKGIEIIQRLVAPLAVLKATPDLLDFGAGEIGIPIEQTLTLTNLGATGDPAIQITEIDLTGANTAEFGYEFDGPITLAPGDSMMLDLTFTPGSLASRSATLVITHSAADMPLTVTLLGAGKAASVLVAIPENADFGTTPIGVPITRNVIVRNQGTFGDPDIEISEITLTGTNPTEFSHEFIDFLKLPAGGSFTLEIIFTPASIGPKTAMLTITHNGVNSPLVIMLSGEGREVRGTVIYRINAGGPPLNATPINWSEDSATNPSPYVNTGRTFGTGGFAGTNTTDAPDALFSTERFDSASGDEMRWKFPVEPGTYEVRLYFAETFEEASAIGARIFSVKIEDILVLASYDIVADVGFNTATVKSFEVTVTDRELTIEFLHGPQQNPLVKGIEIIQLSTTD